MNTNNSKTGLKISERAPISYGRFSSKYHAGDAVLCHWLPEIPCKLTGYFPHQSGWTLRFDPPGEAAMGRMPPPIRRRLYTPSGMHSEWRLSGVTEDDLVHGE